jgi:hypothetical protein
MAGNESSGEAAEKAAGPWVRGTERDASSLGRKDIVAVHFTGAVNCQHAALVPLWVLFVLTACWARQQGPSSHCSNQTRLMLFHRLG